MRRSALLTGGSSGIGRSIAQMLAGQGYDLSVVGIRPHAVEQSCRELSATGVQVHGVAADLADPDRVRELVRWHADRYGRLDVLVNAAGLLGPGALADHDAAAIRRVLDVDLTATVLFAWEALDLLRAAGAEHGQALLVNIASISGKRADPGFSVYCAAKFGVVGFTAAFRQEVAAQGIGACAVCPGLVNTTMGEWAKDWAAPSMMLQPDDIAAAVRDDLLGRPAAQVPAELVIESSA